MRIEPFEMKLLVETRKERMLRRCREIANRGRFGKAMVVAVRELFGSRGPNRNIAIPDGDGEGDGEGSGSEDPPSGRRRRGR